MASVPNTNVYQVALAVTNSGTLMAAGDGKIETVNDGIDRFGRTLTLRIGPGPSVQEPPWDKIKSTLSQLTPFYSLALVVPATASPAPNIILTAQKTTVPLTDVISAGLSLVVTLRKPQVGDPSQTPTWREVANELASLTGSISYGADMTCVGP